MFLNNLFKREKKKILPYTPADFWNWFQKKQSAFYKKIIEDKEVTPAILSEIVEEARKFHPGIYGLMGFVNDVTIEYVCSADGEIKNFVIAQELIKHAPTLKNWQFTCLKSKITDFDPVIHMDGCTFSKEKLHFFTNNELAYPDEIEISLVHEDCLFKTEYNNFAIGSLLYLDNTLGELDFATKIDYVDLVPKDEVPPGTDLIPIEKLSDYLIWRETEFLQKYESPHVSLPQTDECNLLEAEANDFPLLAIIGSAWADWHYKPYYSWCARFIMTFKGNENGLPTDLQLKEIQAAETNLLYLLKPLKVCHIGRVTCQHESTIFFYASEYSQLALAIHRFIQATVFEQVSIEHHISRDKYWRFVEPYL